MGRRCEAYGAGVAAVGLGLRHLLDHAEHPAALLLFTDSQAALRRVQNDAPGPGQQAAREAIGLAGQIIERGSSITLRWVPSHRAVTGNEKADYYAGQAAAEEASCRKGRRPS